MVSRSRVAFLNNWARSCFLRIVFVRRKKPDVTDEHTKKRRRRHDQTRWLHDGITKDKMDSRIHTKTHLREAFREIFDIMKFLPEPEKVHRRPYDGFRCPHEWRDVFTIRAECENFCHRVSIMCQLRDSVTPA